MRTFTFNVRGGEYQVQGVTARAWESGLHLFSVPKFHFFCGSCHGENEKRPRYDNIMSLVTSRREHCGERNLFRMRNRQLLTYR